ncbi:hypothetical protein SAMN02745146_2051 [Hymenobacter daecheongensis DSM 21074]|uniref:Copper-binding protein MbnP-like domain-containing protein n=1 Tax=Hymenobacter daecheongensis DSM 21074 TaxID=1121955 RepID=A0A1M6FZ86_9BACT|nr:MbnP family protein [Hymenobacter daecheongensis]SHJ03011.1 hypothetical protein SAMN02745146_2051 [Hymenobacter daecheongensis DSM 21074]
MKIQSVFLALAVLALGLSSCENKKADPVPETGSLSIEMEHVVGSSALKLNSSTTAFDYRTPSDEWFNVTTFRYYVSNIKLRRADGTEYAQPNSYYLVDAAMPATKVLELKDVPAGDYTGLSFLVGVDAPRNTTGAQEGVLAPGDMFWSWKSGYIFLKMEGYSPAAPGSKVLQFHIGGFEDPNNALRTISPALPSGVKLLVRPDHAPEIHMKADLMKLFVGPTTVKFGSFAIPHMPGANAMKIADNYAAGMFEIDHVHAN